MDRASQWQGLYSGRPEGELGWFQDRPAVSLDLIARAGLDPGGWIIDVGGGASRLVDHLLELGHANLVVLDLVGAGLAAARARLGGRGAAVRWVVADITRWSPPRPFDLWHDRAAFHFLTEEADRAAYAAVMAAAIRPGGQAIIAGFAADGPESCSGLPVRRHDAAQLAAAFAPRFRPIDSVTEIHHTPGGLAQRFQYCRLRRV